MSATADTSAATGKRARAGMPATARFQQGNQKQPEPATGRDASKSRDASKRARAGKPAIAGTPATTI